MATEQAGTGQGRTWSLWLRTGRWLPEQIADPRLEVKFNPYHDPRNGQFTFAPGGRADRQTPKRRDEAPRRHGRGGFGGSGGGNFGGGGASASWDAERSGPASKPAPSVEARTRPTLVGVPAGPAARPAPFKVKAKNGYVFALDDARRTRQVRGELSLAVTASRSRRSQRQAGGSDRRRTDDGGHYIAARFSGPSDAFNHFAQDASFNRGQYRALEDEWAARLRQGRRVSVDIVPQYIGVSKRPSRIVVRWNVSGRSRIRTFENQPKGTAHGR